MSTSVETAAKRKANLNLKLLCVILVAIVVEVCLVLVGIFATNVNGGGDVSQMIVGALTFSFSGFSLGRMICTVISSCVFYACVGLFLAELVVTAMRNKKLDNFIGCLNTLLFGVSFLVGFTFAYRYLYNTHLSNAVANVCGVIVVIVVVCAFIAALISVWHVLKSAIWPTLVPAQEEVEIPQEEVKEEPVASEPTTEETSPVEETKSEGEPVAEEVKKEEPVASEPVAEEVKPTPAPVAVAPVSGATKKVVRRPSFEDKIKNLPEDLQSKYLAIKNEVLKYGIKSRVSYRGETFRLKKVKYVFMSVAGNHLKVYFRLDPKDYENTSLPIIDASKHMKFEEIPVVLKVKSNLSLKRALALVQDVMKKYGIEEKKVRKPRAK